MGPEAPEWFRIKTLRAAGADADDAALQRAVGTVLEARERKKSKKRDRDKAAKGAKHKHKSKKQRERAGSAD